MVNLIALFLGTLNVYVQEKNGIPILLHSISENMNNHWRPVQVPITTTQEFQVGQDQFV